MNSKKIVDIKLVRYITQVIGLIFLPGLFILTYSNLKSLYICVITNNLMSKDAILVSISLISVIGVTIFLGRFFCGWLCAFGTFTDIIYSVANKIFKINFKVSEKVDKSLKYIKYIILFLSIALVWTFQSDFLDDKDPWSAFAQLPDFKLIIESYKFAFVLLIFIIIASIFVERCFCRYLCPLGAVFAIISKFKVLKISKKKDKCGKCRLCTKKCVMGILLYENDDIKNGECINCFKCTKACPRSNVKVTIAKETITPVVVASLAVTSIVGVNKGAKYINNNFISTMNFENSKLKEKEVVKEKFEYKDGIYVGVADGFRPNNELEVLIEDGEIVDVKIIASNDTPSFLTMVFNRIIPQIIESQSLEVDVVSGATLSSKGILNAIKDALSKAKSK